jgi:hypothetical protein
MVPRVKDMLGQIPAAAAAYSALRPGRPRTRYNLDQLAARLPQALADVRTYGRATHGGKKLVLFATLHYWIEQAVLVGLALRAMGNEVAIAFLPYSNWQKETNRFDLQRQDLYTRRVLKPAADQVNVISLLDRGATGQLPDDLARAAEQASSYDVMYSLQSEEVDRESALYHLRLERNLHAGRAAISVLKQLQPDVALIPNGLVTELGMFYQAARGLKLPSVTYEFNDQREQIWLAQDEVVMEQNTDALWAARGIEPLTKTQTEKIRAFEAARSGAKTYGKGTRLWQDVPPQGAQALHLQLALDDRPVLLLATNVLGDSLTLGRHVFAASMAEWIEKTIQYLAARSDVQVVVRIHPGERLIHGPSMAAVIQRSLPTVPPHIHVIGPRDATNTYDLMELASVGLVYTTTVGMEMAMRGVPVLVAGKTHFRGRGFTLDPSSWEEYFRLLDDVLSHPRAHRLGEDAVKTAWNYGYRFFFEYPHDFPWRLMHLWTDFEEWPLARLLSTEGEAAFGRTLRYLAGEPIAWHDKVAA